MAQRKIDRTGNESEFRTLAKIDQNFNDLFGSMIVQDADYTFTSTTAAQQMFNATTNGEVGIGIGTYEFETDFNMTGISATSGTFGFALGANNGLVIGSQGWYAIAMKSTLATEAATVSTYNVAANTALTAAGTGTVGWAHIKGVFRVTTGGNLQPQVSFSTITGGPTPSVKINSWFKVRMLSAISTDAVFGEPQPNSNGLNWI